MTARYAAACGAREVHGLDVARLAEASARGVRAIQFDLNGRERLPYADRSFDLVTCLETLEHLVEPDRIVAEAFRILRPGGTLVVDVPRLDSWMTIVLLLLGRQPSGVECSLRRRYGAMNRDSVLTGHVSYFTRRAFREMLEVAGFRLDGESGAGMGRGYRADRHRRGLRVGAVEGLASWINDRLPLRKDFLIVRATRPAGDPPA